MTVQVTDTFLRADNASSWGTASDGTTVWAKTGTGTVSIASNEGKIVSTGADTHMQAGSHTSGDCNNLVRFSVSNQGDSAALQGRFSSASGTSCYKIIWYGGNIHINKAVSGTFTQLTQAAYTLVNGTFYWMRLSIVGTAIKGRIWQDGTTEPTTWNVSVTDSTVTGAGGYALQGDTASGSAGVKFDSFTADDTLTSSPTTSTTTILESVPNVSAETAATSTTDLSVTSTTYILESVPNISAETVATSTLVGGGGGGGGTITPGPLPGLKMYGTVSEGVFGTNSANYKPVLFTDTTVQAKLKDIGIRVVRWPVNDSNGNSYTDGQIDQALNAVSAAGAVSLIILRRVDQTYNAHVVSYAGSRCLLYEFSNEPDIAKPPWPISQYTATWNTNVPIWRGINPSAKFGGPVLGAVSNQGYLQSWLQSAKAAGVDPDFVSIHNYPDYGSNPGSPPASQSIQDAFKIGQSAQNVQNYIVSLYGHTIPLCVTEWNVDALFAQPYRDDPLFARQFLNNAIKGMIDAGVVIANQFEITTDYLYGHKDQNNVQIGPSYAQPTKDAIAQYLVGTTGGGGGSATPTIGVSPASLSFTAQTGASSPLSQNTVVSNIGNGVGTWTVSGVPTWLTLNATTGTIQAGGLQNVLLTASQAGLAVGTYSATLTYTMGTTTATQTVSLTVTAATVTFTGVTPLSLYMTAVASALNASADQLYTTSGAPATITQNYTLIGTSLGWGELPSQGSTLPWAALAAIGPPTGLGYFFDAPSLQGNLLVAGQWSASTRLNCWANNVQSGTITADIVIRAFKWNAGVYTPIVSISLPAASITSAFTTFFLNAILTSITTAFGVGDYLYIDEWPNITANNNAQPAQQIRHNRLSTDTAIAMPENAVVTPGYSTGIPVPILEQIPNISAETVVTITDLGQLVLVTESVPSISAETVASSLSNLPTTPGVSVQIAGVSVPIREGTFLLDDTLSSMSTCSFTVRDDAGSMNFTRGMQVLVYDYANGRQYTGVIATVDRENVRPQTLIFAEVATRDNHWFAEKRTYTGQEYTGVKAGAIAADMLQGLAAEGITAPVATRRELTQSDFAQGTLTGVVSTVNVGTGDLELAQAGTLISITEKTTQDWIASGSVLNGTYYGNNNLLTLFPNNALKLQGTASQGGNNNFSYLKIWAGNQVIAQGDVLTYFVWISSTSPVIKAGVDGVFTDGSTIRDNINFIDQNGLQAHPNTDLSGYANDQRYKRAINIGAYAGKTLAYITVVLEGDPAGTYDAYFDTIQLINGTTIKQNFYLNSLQTVVQLQNVGYSNVTLTQVQTYTNPGTRVSPAYSLQGAGIAGASQVNWVEELLTSPTVTPELGGAVGANKTAFVLVETSIDNKATWQICTNHSPIPNLLPGQSLSGVTLYFRQTINVAGPDPTISPALQLCSFSLTPAYAATKSDARLAAGSTNGFAGVLNGVAIQNAGDLTLSSILRNYAQGDGSGHTIFGSGVAYGGIITSQFQIGCTTNATDVRARLDFAGTWASPFTMEVDVYVNSFGDYGVVYMASNWLNGNNATNGYTAMLSLTNIYLGYMSGGVFTQLANVGGLGLSAGVWHRLKITVNGSNHRIYLDDVLYINVTTSQYTSGQFGYRYYNTSGVQHSGFFNNFGVVASLQGSWVSQGVSLGAVNAVGNSIIQWNNAPLPSNASLVISASTDNITFTPCTNNVPLPASVLASGQNVSAVTLYIKAALGTNNANVTPDLLGLSVTVIGAYSSSGSRVSAALDLSTVTGTLGDSSVGWNVNLPTGTTLGVDTAVDGGAWTNITGRNGAGIPGLLYQPAPSIDPFTSAQNYLNTFGNGGSAASWTPDYSNHRIAASGGTLGLFINFATKATDVDLFVDMDQSDAGGLVWGYVDQNNYYECVLGDASSSIIIGGGTSTPARYILRGLSGPLLLPAIVGGGGGTPIANTISIYKMVAGVRTRLVAGSIAFTRGTYHRIRVTMLAGVIAASMDGVNILNYTDGTPLVGSCGLRNSTGISRYYQLRVQPIGQSCIGHSVQMRLRLTSTNPQATPRVLNTIMAAWGTTIQAGAIVPRTAYFQKYFASNFDDLVKQCSASGGQWWWYIDKNKVFSMLPENGVPAPWIATDNPGDFLNKAVKLLDQSDLYRNRSIIQNVLATTSINENRLGDGVNTTWTFGNQWYAAPTILVNGVPASVGIKNVDTGKQFYWTQGSATITEDASGPLYDQTYTLNFSGTGQYLAYSQYDNALEQQALALLEGGTGIVEVIEDGKGMPKAQGDALAASRVAQYGVRGQVLTGTTRRYGLQPGHLLAIVLPSLQTPYTEFLVSRIRTKLQTEFSASQNAMIQQGIYDVEGITGPDLKGWEQLYLR